MNTSVILLSAISFVCIAFLAIKKYKIVKNVRNKEIRRLLSLPTFELKRNKTDPLERAIENRELEKKLHLCKKEKICPICSGHLSEYCWDNGDEFHPENYSIVYCKKCETRFEQDTEFYY